MVKDVADIRNFMREQADRNVDEKQDAKEKKATALKWKLTAVASLFSLLGVVIGFILTKF